MADPAFERLPFLDAEPWRVAVVNPTGRYARNQVAGLLAAGTNIVGGVALGRGGQSMDGLPLVDRIAELPDANVALVYTRTASRRASAPSSRSPNTFRSTTRWRWRRARAPPDAG